MKSARTKPVWDDVTAATAAWWQDTASPQTADVIVVGAGIAGLTTAMCLLREGRRVTLLDRHGIGAGETLRSTAHLASALDDRFTALSRYHGHDGARLAAQSHAAAIDWIAAMAVNDPMACAFRRLPGYLFSHRADADALQDECEAAARAGLEVELQREGLPALPALGPLLRFADQARADIGGYLQTLANAVREAGAGFVRGEVTAIEGGDRPRVSLRDGRELQAASVVVASNVPVYDSGPMWLKQAAYRTFVVVGWAAADAIPDALYWDDADPYHYVRLRPLPGHEPRQEVQVIIGGADHKTGQEDDPAVYATLQQWARERFPGLLRFSDAWSGQILEPADGLA